MGYRFEYLSSAAEHADLPDASSRIASAPTSGANSHAGSLASASSGGGSRGGTAGGYGRPKLPALAGELHGGAQTLPKTPPPRSPGASSPQPQPRDAFAALRERAAAFVTSMLSAPPAPPHLAGRSGTAPALGGGLLGYQRRRAPRDTGGPRGGATSDAGEDVSPSFALWWDRHLRSEHESHVMDEFDHSAY